MLKRLSIRLKMALIYVEIVIFTVPMLIASYCAMRYLNNTEINAASKFVSTFGVTYIVYVVVYLFTTILLGRKLTSMISKPLVKATNTLYQVTESLHNTTEQFNSSSISLAESGSEQAAAIEETSATMNQTTAMIKQNNENTLNARDLIEKMDKSLTEVVMRNEELIKSMGELNTSSKKISDIFTAISSISSQTNILALNAAVESARAGEAGRSFAVVAEEVRSLSQQTANSVNETESIVKNNQALTVKGVENTNSVGKALSDVIEAAQKVSYILNELTHASEEQTRGAQQINSAMAQIGKVTQSNAAISEESAAASNELKTQMEDLLQVYSLIDTLVKGDKSA